MGLRSFVFHQQSATPHTKRKNNEFLLMSSSIPPAVANAYIMTRELAGNFARLSIRLSCRHSYSIISIHRDPERSHRIERSVVDFYGPGSRVWPERRIAMVVD